MRIAIVSDIHGNRTAFEAVLADLTQTSPDLIFHGGDLADGGANPAESWTTFAISDGKESLAIQMKCIRGQNPWKSLRANHQRRRPSGRPFVRWRWRREQCWERTGSHGCADCRVFRFRIRLPWCTLALRVPGTH